MVCSYGGYGGGLIQYVLYMVTFIGKMTDIEMVQTEIPEDEEEILSNVDENTSLRNENIKKVKHSNWQTLCCKAFIILIAVIVFLAILIRSWSDYGTYITKHVFPPSVHSVSVQCQGYSKNFFNEPICSWNQTTYGVDLNCVLDKPSNYFVDISAREDADIVWEDTLVVHFQQNITCTNLIVWSI